MSLTWQLSMVSKALDLRFASVDRPDKGQIIEQGLSFGVNYAETVSCYRLNAMGEACGQCDSCVIRAEGFRQAGVSDPTRYLSS